MKIDAKNLGKSADLLSLIEFVEGMMDGQQILGHGSNAAAKMLKKFLIDDYKLQLVARVPEALREELFAKVSDSNQSGFEIVQWYHKKIEQSLFKISLVECKHTVDLLRDQIIWT